MHTNPARGAAKSAALSVMQTIPRGWKTWEYSQLSIDQSIILPYLNSEEIYGWGQRAAQRNDSEDFESDPELQDYGRLRYHSWPRSPLLFPVRS